MKNNIKMRFRIVVISALATVGILFISFGKPPYTKHCHHHHYMSPKAQNEVLKK